MPASPFVRTVGVVLADADLLGHAASCQEAALSLLQGRPAAGVPVPLLNN